MILITGAGGKTGRTLIETLSKVESVCAFVHRATSMATAKALGAEKVISGDLLDESSFKRALKGVRTVYHICPNMSPDEVRLGRQVIQSTKEAEIEHFIYHSVMHPHTEKMTHHWNKLRVEEMLFESGLPFTILQPAPYMQNLQTSWKSIFEEGLLRVPYSIISKFSFIDLVDLAEAAKMIIAEVGHKNATYELAGTLPTSHVEVAEIMERVLNWPIRAEQEEISAWKVRAGGISEYTMENLIRMFDYYDQWGLPGNPNILRWVLKREPTTLESFIRRSINEHKQSSGKPV